VECVKVLGELFPFCPFREDMEDTGELRRGHYELCKSK